MLIEKLFIPSKLERIKSGLIQEIEKLKSFLSKEQFIHKLQFDKEFNIYIELWKAIDDLRSSTARLIPIMKLEEDESELKEDELKKKRLKQVAKDMFEVRELLEKKKPFYDSEVYSVAWEIVKKSISQIGRTHFPERDVSKHYLKALKTVDEINKIFPKVEEAIRERIGNMGKAKLLD